MGFMHGTAAKLYANGYALHTFMRGESSPATVEAAEVTTQSKTAKVYIPGMADASLNMEGYFDGAALAVDAILAGIFRAAAQTIVCWWPQGDDFGSYGYGMLGDETQYEIGSNTSAASSVTAALQSSVARERMVCLHALAARTTDSQGTAVEVAALTSLGGVGYVQVTAVGGGGGDLYLEHSSDNITFATLIEFLNIAAIGAFRTAAVVGTVNKYVRARWDIDGGGSLTFQMGFQRL